MNYFIDTEFVEGTQKTWFNKQTKPTIDLISIGIVGEDGREYYAISKDFNLKEAWNRYDLKINKHFPQGPEYNKEYWLRENVLFPIWCELMFKSQGKPSELHKLKTGTANDYHAFTYKSLKQLISKYGKPNKQIAEEIKSFVDPLSIHNIIEYKEKVSEESFIKSKIDKVENNINFYGYYSDYDWVVFAQLFGTMVDLPKGFPMYCIDLKQELDSKAMGLLETTRLIEESATFEQSIEYIKNKSDYPKQVNEHNALEDARWNKQLYEFLKQSFKTIV